ncbi:hypothetical protein DFH08DRAFT_1028407 [Mycena albidolilacea]|uniref:Uncharacterized protein n=1 Tax=Mycena albidolilacea TaxID=1033008 RepID=A0AAD6ZJC2_9AGAR|nr:hypothetical protein DFH08DRAFT_1028407 [Mycena albidolilacea]
MSILDLSIEKVSSMMVTTIPGLKMTSTLCTSHFPSNPHEKPGQDIRTEETFIVTALPQIVRDGYDLSPSIQDTKFAVTPIHTNEEYSLFNKALRPSGTFAAATGPPNFKRMAKWWSAQVDGKKIFFKFPKHFQAHFKTWNALCTKLMTMQLTENARAEFMDIIVVLDESFSPVVQGRKAAPSSAKIALCNLQIRDISDIPTASTSKATLDPSRLLPPPPRVSPPPPIQFQSAPQPPPITTVLASTSRPKPRALKNCAVCESVKDFRQAPECPGSGKRSLCPHWKEAGAVGPIKLVP